MLLWTLVYKYLLKILPKFFGPYTRIRIARSYGNTIIFKRISILFSTAVIPLYIPTNSAQGSHFRTSSPTVVIFCFFFYSSHPNEREGCLFVVFFVFFFLFFTLYLFIYLFLAVLGLRFCVWVFSSCGEWGPLFIAVRGALTVAAFLVAEHRLQTHRLSTCGSRA